MSGIYIFSCHNNSRLENEMSLDESFEALATYVSSIRSGRINALVKKAPVRVTVRIQINMRRRVMAWDERYLFGPASGTGPKYTESPSR